MASIIIPGTAGVGDVLAGKVFSAGTNYQATGTMVDRGTVSTDITTKAQQVTIAAGKHSGSGIVKISATEQAKIIAGNIRSGVTILGQTGNSNVVDTSSGDATAAQILATKKAWVDGSEVTGSMINRTNVIGTQYNAGGTGLVAIYPPQGYWDGTQVTWIEDSDYIASNILSTANIFGLAGSAVPISGTLSGIQMGSISLSTSQATNIAYISPVTLANSVVIPLGVSVAGDGENSAVISGSQVGLELTNTTTVTATRGILGNGYTSLIANFLVLSFNSGAIKSKQSGIITKSHSVASAIATISSVTTTKALLINSGSRSVPSDPGWDIMERAVAKLALTNSTTITTSTAQTGTTVYTNWQLLEFN